jgi:hypothetical protein
MLGEGWKGVASPVPLARTELAVPGALAALGEGPVLDLPATRSANQRALWLQVAHRQPVATDADGLLAPQVQAAVDLLAQRGCPDLGALGFASVVARRTEALSDPAAWRDCLGTPVADDGEVAAWRLPRAPRADVTGRPP